MRHVKGRRTDLFSQFIRALVAMLLFEKKIICYKYTEFRKGNWVSFVAVY